MLIALLILAVTIALFIWEPIPIVVTAIGASILYAYTGIIEVNTIFSGYNSTTFVLLAGMMVVGSSLFHSGVTDIIGEKMVKITGKSERNIILATLIVSCVLSAVCSNIGVMVAMAPLVTAMCISAGYGPSKALLALLFGSQFGGFVTLVGVGSNASAAGVMQELGYEPFGFSLSRLLESESASSELSSLPLLAVRCCRIPDMFLNLPRRRKRNLIKRRL